MRRPSKFNEEVAAFEARIASVKKGFDAKLQGTFISHYRWVLLYDSYSMSQPWVNICWWNLDQLPLSLKIHEHLLNPLFPFDIFTPFYDSSDIQHDESTVFIQKVRILQAMCIEWATEAMVMNCSTRQSRQEEKSQTDRKFFHRLRV